MKTFVVVVCITLLLFVSAIQPAPDARADRLVRFPKRDLAFDDSEKEVARSRSKRGWWWRPRSSCRSLWCACKQRWIYAWCCFWKSTCCRIECITAGGYTG